MCITIIRIREGKKISHHACELQNIISTPDSGKKYPYYCYNNNSLRNTPMCMFCSYRVIKKKKKRTTGVGFVNRFFFRFRIKNQIFSDHHCDGFFFSRRFITLSTKLLLTSLIEQIPRSVFPRFRFRQRKQHLWIFIYFFFSINSFPDHFGLDRARRFHNVIVQEVFYRLWIFLFF